MKSVQTTSLEDMTSMIALLVLCATISCVYSVEQAAAGSSDATKPPSQKDLLGSFGSLNLSALIQKDKEPSQKSLLGSFGSIGLPGKSNADKSSSEPAGASAVPASDQNPQAAPADPATIPAATGTKNPDKQTCSTTDMCLSMNGICNKGRCVNVVKDCTADIKCECDAGYTGQFCSTAIADIPVTSTVTTPTEAAVNIQTTATSMAKAGANTNGKQHVNGNIDKNKIIADYTSIDKGHSVNTVNVAKPTPADNANVDKGKDNGQTKVNAKENSKTKDSGNNGTPNAIDNGQSVGSYNSLKRGSDNGEKQGNGQGSSSDNGQTKPNGNSPAKVNNTGPTKVTTSDKLINSNTKASDENVNNEKRNVARKTSPEKKQPVQTKKNETTGGDKHTPTAVSEQLAADSNSSYRKGPEASFKADNSPVNFDTKTQKIKSVKKSVISRSKDSVTLTTLSVKNTFIGTVNHQTPRVQNPVEQSTKPAKASTEVKVKKDTRHPTLNDKPHSTVPEASTKKVDPKMVIIDSSNNITVNVKKNTAIKTAKPVIVREVNGSVDLQNKMVENINLQNQSDTKLSKASKKGDPVSAPQKSKTPPTELNGTKNKQGTQGTVRASAKVSKSGVTMSDTSSSQDVSKQLSGKSQANNSLQTSISELIKPENSETPSVFSPIIHLLQVLQSAELADKSLAEIPKENLTIAKSVDVAPVNQKTSAQDTKFDVGNTVKDGVASLTNSVTSLNTPA